MIAYTGIETISNMAEEAKDEAVTIPKAIARVRTAVYAIYFTLPVVALSALPVTRDPATGEYSTLLGVAEEDGGFAGDPILGVVKQLDLGFLQEPGELYVGLLAATILLIATNAGIIGVSRLVYSMGIHRQVPDRLRQLHPRFNTPWIGILVFGVIACLTLLPGQATFLGNMYAFGAMLSFTIAHAAVIRMRLTEPDRERPYRGPGTLRIAGRELPGFAVFGGLATLLSFLVVTALNPVVAVSGTIWLALGIAIYALYRRRHGLDLVTTAKIAVPRPVTASEAEYESVLIALEVDHFTPADRRHRRQARRPRRARDLRPRDDHRAPGAAAGRQAARAGGQRRRRDRAGAAARRTTRDRAGRQGPRRPGRARHRRRGARDSRAGDRHAAAPAHRHDDLRQDRRNRPRRAPLPRHHRERAVALTS